MYLFPQEYRESLSVEVFTSYQYLVSGSCLIHANRFMGLWPLKTFNGRHKVSILSNNPDWIVSLLLEQSPWRKEKHFFSKKLGSLGFRIFPPVSRMQIISALSVFRSLNMWANKKFVVRGQEDPVLDENYLTGCYTRIGMKTAQESGRFNYLLVSHLCSQ